MTSTYFESTGEDSLIFSEPRLKIDPKKKQRSDGKENRVTRKTTTPSLRSGKILLPHMTYTMLQKGEGLKEIQSHGCILSTMNRRRNPTWLIKGNRKAIRLVSMRTSVKNVAYKPRPREGVKQGGMEQELVNSGKGGGSA